MARRRENFRYHASGLPGVTLLNVIVNRCPKCGEYEVEIHRLEELHRVIAMALIRKRARLTGPEIRFLRKFLGWSGADFARHMRAAAETVSRWETESTPIGPQADALLRLMIAYTKPITDYSIADLKDTGTAAAKPLKIEVSSGRSGWKAAKAA